MVSQQWLKTAFVLVVASGIFAAGCKKDEATTNPGTAFLYAISYNYVLANSNAAVLIGEAMAVRTITLQ